MISFHNCISEYTLHQVIIGAGGIIKIVQQSHNVFGGDRNGFMFFQNVSKAYKQFSNLRLSKFRLTFYHLSLLGNYVCVVNMKTSKPYSVSLVCVFKHMSNLLEKQGHFSASLDFSTVGYCRLQVVYLRET